MKEQELRESAECVSCGKPFGHTGVPLFWRVTIERYGLNIPAAQRQDALARFFGGDGLLAFHMGENADLASRLGPARQVTLCESCAVRPVLIPALAEVVEEPEGQG